MTLRFGDQTKQVKEPGTGRHSVAPGVKQRQRGFRRGEDIPTIEIEGEKKVRWERRRLRILELSLLKKFLSV